MVGAEALQTPDANETSQCDNKCDWTLNNDRQIICQSRSSRTNQSEVLKYLENADSEN